MEEMISYCGLKCHDCGAFRATQNNDDKLREQVAGLWSKQYNARLSAEDINCDGCTTRSDTLFRHCRVCKIRKCAVETGVASCADCGNYACDTLESFFRMVPEARITLEGLRNSR